MDLLKEIEECTTTPFPNCYWVDEELLLAGCYPGDADQAVADAKLSGLAGFGITRVISLMEEGERDRYGASFAPYEEGLKAAAAARKKSVAFERYPIKDLWVPSRETMKAILDDIDSSVAEGKRIYIHCWGGIGRTGTVVGCYLIRHKMADRASVFDEIKKLRAGIKNDFRPSPETEAQRKFVEGWPPGE